MAMGELLNLNELWRTVMRNAQKKDEQLSVIEAKGNAIWVLATSFIISATEVEDYDVRAQTACRSP